MKNAFLSLIAMMIFSLFAGCQMDQSESASSESTAMTSQQVIEFLDELFMEELQESPQYMTYLGMRERYDEWDDNSDEARDKSLQMTREHLQRVESRRCREGLQQVPTDRRRQEVHSN